MTDWLDELLLEPGPPSWSMGTRAIGDADREFAADAHEERDLRLKAELLATRHDEVFTALDTDAVLEGSRATLGLVEAATGRAGDRGLHPLDAAGRLVQPDLCVLVLRDGDVFLDAASLCFPSYWRLADKLGRPIVEVHAPVPGFDRELGPRVRDFIARLRPGRAVWRRNWSVHDDPAYFLPAASSHSCENAELYLRSERQSLRRLAGTDAVLFTIRTQQIPLKVLRHRPDVAARMAAVIESWSDDVVAYKGGHGAVRALALLRSMAR